MKSFDYATVFFEKSFGVAKIRRKSAGAPPSHTGSASKRANATPCGLAIANFDPWPGRFNAVIGKTSPARSYCSSYSFGMVPKYP